MPIFPNADLTVDEISLRILYNDDDVAEGFSPRFPFSRRGRLRSVLLIFQLEKTIYFFFTCHVKYNVDITPACYSNPLIFMSYNSHAPRKSRVLLKLFRRMILSPSLVVYADDKTHGTLSIINGRRDMWYLETVC